MTPQSPVNLDNCDQEPIHIPGLVQPHGALVAFDADGRTTHVSANAAQLLGPTVPAAGELLQPRHFGGAIHPHLGTGDDADGLPGGAGVELDGKAFDLVVHRSGGRTIAEFELRPSTPDQAADFALKAHRAMERLKRQPSIDSLLQIAVSAVRQLTGFDRVMAYRFRHDDSGDVVAESRIESLEPFVGRRYPASDIPAQARRLYLINTLRLVADIGATPVALVAAPGVESPLDMSHCVLRSVSPIHIEYLRNMGVGASMSISIVVNGVLWGMLACHHMAPLQVPYSVRMACDVLAQILAANVQSLLAREQAQLAATAAQLRARVVEATLHADDAVAALTATAADMLVAFDAQALVIAGESRLHVLGDLPAELPARLVQWLDARMEPGEPLLETSQLASFAPELAPVCGVWRGLLALCFDPGAHGWLVLLRKEQIETIQWGGRPEKNYDVGPLGVRLTPRGSFDVWRETVRDMAVPWTAPDLDFARLLLSELTRAGAARSAEVARGRRQLMALLGADALRSTGVSAAEEAGAVSANARTATLIGQVLDVSRLQSGAGLEMHFDSVDLGVLLRDLLADARKADPDVTIYFEGPRSLMAHADATRLMQVFAHLIGNARHHGAPGEAVMVQLDAPGDGTMLLDVSNVSPPIAPEIEAQLFSAFRPQPTATGRVSRSRTGLGVGLHIAQAIAQAHGGSIEYNHADPFVVFSVRLPIVVPNA